MSSVKTPVNILLLVTGSIAAVKVGLLVDKLFDEPCHIRIAATKSAFHFLTRAQHPIRDILVHRILTDEDEWKEWQGMNDAVMHIELRRWADLVVIAPLDANTLAKISNGLCDNLVTCVMRAWEVREKPVIVCPAMNTAMWNHPVTSQQLHTLEKWYGNTEQVGENNNNNNCGMNIDLKITERAQEETMNENNNNNNNNTSLPDSLDKLMFQIVGPVKKRLACGDIGVGGMAGVDEIARVIRHTADHIRAKRAAAAAQIETTAINNNNNNNNNNNKIQGLYQALQLQEQEKEQEPQLKEFMNTGDGTNLQEK